MIRTRSGLKRMACGLGLALVLGGGGMVQAQTRAVGEAPSGNNGEGGLWGLSEDAERAAQARADRNRDPALNAYVSTLTCKLARDHCGDLRVYVMDRPVFNAGAAPNGYVEVWSGLMLRAATEDELAFVLGHEITHFLEEHAYEQLRRHKIVSNVVMAATLGAGAAGVYYQVDVGDLVDALYLARLASYFGYSQSQESQSDELGLRLAYEAGYDPAAAAGIWTSVQGETAASSFRRVRQSEAAGSAFRTHPLTSHRVEALTRQASVLVPKPHDPEARRTYRAVIRPHLADWLEDEHRHRDSGRLLYLLERLGADGEDLGLISFHRGEVYRRRREAGDEARALAAYRQAVGHADAPAAAWRELGTLEARAGRSPEAREAFETYRRLVPAADDLWIIDDQLARLEAPQ